MIAGRAVGALVGADLRNVHRDSWLRWLAVLPVGIAVLMRVGIPMLEEELQRRLAFDLVRYYPLIASSLFLFMPAVVGGIAGFLLLDLRDDRTLAAVRVTPLGLRGFLAYRLLVPMLLSLPVAVVLVKFVALVEIGLGAVLLAAVAAAPIAPVYALFLGTFARNKVQGFALMKAAGILSWPPIIAWWVPEPWQWLLGVVPYYWPVKLFWVLESGAPGATLFLAVGLVYQGLLLWLLLRRAGRLMLD